MMHFSVRATILAASAALSVTAAAYARTIYHCNQATQHCVNGTVPYNVDANPPSAADRRGLLKAFDRAHRNRSNLALVGFRVDSPHSAAAYYLITGPDHSTYVAAHTDLFHRTHGHSWAHVSHFKNANPAWNDVDNLVPGFLWKAIGDGSGTYVSQQTTTPDGTSDTTSYYTQASFSWSFSYGHGRVLDTSDGSSDNASPSLVGQISAGTTDPSNPAQNASCTGSVKDIGGGSEPPFISFAEYPHNGKTTALDFTVGLVSQLSWPSSCSSDWATVPADSRFVVGARVPLATLESHGFYSPGGVKAHPVLNGQPFDLPVDDFAPTAAPDAKPHQSTFEDDGVLRSTSTEDLKLAGTLHFKLVGLYMPLGMDGFPHPPVRADGKVPPVL